MKKESPENGRIFVSRGFLTLQVVNPKANQDQVTRSSEGMSSQTALTARGGSIWVAESCFCNHNCVPECVVLPHS